jgi:flagellar hook-associated protein 1 FlgK
MAGILGIGMSGIQTAQMGLLATQHNIANSNTDGYTRQSIVQSTTTPLGTSSGSVGTGVRVTTIQRNYNNFLNEQVTKSEAELSSLDAYYKQISVIDDLLADSSAGVSPALQDFFKGVQQVSNSPASLPARQAMLSSAQALVNRLQGADQRISDLYGQVNQEISDGVTAINAYGAMISEINQRITIAEGAVGQPANDLLDQRDQLVSELNKLVKVNVIPVGKDGIQVFIGKGQLLVMGGQVNPMTAVKSTADPSRISMALDLGAGAQELPDDLFTGGSLGGLMKFRSETLDRAVNSLGKIAVSLASTFNEQHKTGMDMLGNEQGDAGFKSDFFTLASPKVVPNRLNGAAVVSASFTTPALSSNLADGNYVSNVTNSDYQLQYNGANLSLTRLSDKKVWSGATIAAVNAQITGEGFALANPSGAFVSGDSFLIEPTREAARNIGINQEISTDVRLLAAALPIRATIGLTNAGTTAVSVGRVSIDTTLPTPASVAFPLTVTLGAGATTLTIAAGGPHSVKVFNSSGAAVAGSPFSLAPASATPPPVADGYSYELADGNRRITFTIKGVRQTGDTFKLDKNDGSSPGTTIGVSDSGNMLLLGRLQTQRAADGGATSFQGAYAQMVSDIGNKAHEIQVTHTAQISLVAQASAARESQSGVNLDEEAANLLKYQQMYQASARAISIGQSIFDELLNVARG